MGRGDHDARVAIVITGGEAQGRDRHEFVIDADVDAVGGKNTGRGAGEVPAFETAVVADGDGLGASLGFDPVGDSLGGLTDDPDVHAVGTSAKSATEAGRTEFQCDGEPVFDRLIVPLDVLQLFL